MKRGCRLVALYADNGKYLGCSLGGASRGASGDVSSDGSARKRCKERVTNLLKALQSWSAGWRIPAFSFDNGKNLDRFVKLKLKTKTSGKNKNKIVSNRFACLLCKRMMYRVANELAEQLYAKAVVTGETLGEVASQTLDNLVVLDEASELPVFRPLIGNDKQESIDLAKRIGTYENSISVSSVCKAVPPMPRTKGRISEVKLIESKLPMKKLLRESLKSTKPLK
jgi:hypothetical protein